MFSKVLRRYIRILQTATGQYWLGKLSLQIDPKCFQKVAMKYQTVRYNYLSRDCPRFFTCHQKAAFKNHPRNMFHYKNHLDMIPPSNMKYSNKNMKMLTGGGILKFQKNCHNLKFHLTHSLPDHSRRPRAQMKQRMATILHHNNKLTSEIEMCLLGFRKVWGLCTSFYLPLGSSSSCSKTISISMF